MSVKEKWNSGGGLFLNNLRNKAVMLTALSSMLLVGLGCETDDKEFPTIEPPPVVDGDFTQYGTPFGNVPNTSDIAMYEVNIGAFSSRGNLQGVEARLDEIKDLGINVIWLMPIYPSGDLNGVGSPYAVKNYMQVNPEFGTLNSLRLLVEEAHERDMAVILDWVANHTAWDNPWIETHPEWYTTDNSGHIISPEGMGWTDVADLNYANAEMKAEMISAMKYWVLEANIDGYRCDYAEGVPIDFWEQAIDTLSAIPDREIIMFAEAADKEMFSAGFDLIFGWYFYSRLEEVFNDNVSATILTTANTNDYENVPGGSHILRWVTNHDDNAWEGTPEAIFNGQDGALAAFVVTAYMGGVPLIYNGQEVGFSTQLSFFEGTNTKIDWSGNPEVLAEYQELMAFRNKSDAVKTGTTTHYSTANVVAFKRISGTEEVVVIVNVRNNEVNYQLPASLANTSWEGVLSSQTVTLNDVVSLKPYSYLILRQ